MWRYLVFEKLACKTVVKSVQDIAGGVILFTASAADTQDIGINAQVEYSIQSGEMPWEVSNCSCAVVLSVHGSVQIYYC